jgi:hypothetical protein
MWETDATPSAHLRYETGGVPPPRWPPPPSVPPPSDRSVDVPLAN